MTEYAARLETIRSAREVIDRYAHKTPVFTSTTLDKLAGRRLFFKAENLQRTGSFKFRGACHAVFRLDADVARRGIVTHSSGNHGQALALAAKLRGVPAHVVMPSNAPEAKRSAVLGYGARVVPCEPTLEAREATCLAVAGETGATIIPPYDHPDVIAGQGSVALELLEQVPELEAIVAPIGGGGLISGIALAAKELVPEIHIFGVEPAGADDAARSKAAKQRLPQKNPQTIADGLRTSLGEHTWPVVRDKVDRIFSVSDEEIVAALRLVFERMKLVVEPSGAVSVAGLLTGVFRALPGLGRVGVVLTGGNVDMAALPALLGAV